MKLEHLYTVVITPFDDQGKLDKAGFRRNLQNQIKQGIKGIVVLGTTGEAPTLSHNEKRAVIEMACEEVKGKASFFVGTGSYSTEQTIENTREARDLGAEGALIVTPYYNKPTQEGLFRHFAKVCESVDLPICIYNIQGRTGQNLETSTLQRLLAFPTIVAVKESSGNITQMNDVLELVERQNSPVKILSGDDALTLPLMSLGGHGVFSVISNLLPGPVNKMVQAAVRGDYEQARALHFQTLPFMKAAFVETNPIPIKAAMRLCGLPAGECRLPLCELTPTNLQKLQLAIDNLPPAWLSING